MKHRPQIAVSLALVAAALSGCATAGDRSGIANVNASSAAAAHAENASWTATLFLTTEGKLANATPEKEGHVTLPQPVNGPFIGGAPAWTGTVARNFSNVSLRLFATSSTANVAANAFPLVPLPSATAYVTVGNATLEVSLDGPPIVRAGEVVEFRGETTLAKEAAAGELKLRVIPYYSHVTTAAEFRFVMGPAH